MPDLSDFKWAADAYATYDPNDLTSPISVFHNQKNVLNVPIRTVVDPGDTLGVMVKGVWIQAAPIPGSRWVRT